MLLPLLAVLVPTVQLLVRGGDGGWFVLLGGPLAVIAIISRSRMWWEHALEERGWPGRETWLPALLVLLLIGSGALTPGQTGRVMLGKLDIIVFIMSFALVSEGLSESGLFHFIAFRIAERCRGSTARLILYFFVLTSVLTLLTSNDIVILALTPIIVSVCVQSRIRNVRFILLTQFVAANTLSMGLLIGSPTNLIVGQSLGIDFFRYAFILLLPAVLAFLATYVVIDVLVRASQRAEIGAAGVLEAALVRGWSYNERYDIPQFSEFQQRTPAMAVWTRWFTISVAILAVVTAVDASLYWAAVPIGLGSLVLAALGVGLAEGATPRSARQRLDSQISAVPWGILGFGLSFFTLVDVLLASEVFDTVLKPVLDAILTNGGITTSVGGIAASGLAVNMVNDLPASALFAESMVGFTFPTDLHAVLAQQAVLAGLNIGTYITPVGALAGIIWFRVMRREADRAQSRTGELAASHEALVLPRRSDLVRFGAIVFVAVTVMLGLMLYGLAGLVSFLLGNVDDEQLLVTTRSDVIWSIVGLAVIGVLLVLFRRALAQRDVVLAHVSDAFLILNRINLFALRNRLTYSVMIVGVVLLSAAGLLYWSELTHADLYAIEPEFDSLKRFAAWFLAFVGSGYEQDLFPTSMLGILLSGLLPLLGIAAIVQLLRVPGHESRERLRARLATGRAPADRVAVVGFGADDVELLAGLIEQSDRFVVLFTRNDEAARSSIVTSNEGRDRVHVSRLTPDPHDDITSYSLLSCKEIIFLSDGTVETDYRNLRMLGALDDFVHGDAEEHGGGPLPKILFECSDQEIASLMRRSVSQDLAPRIASVTIDEAVAEYLAVDLLADTVALDELYRLGSHEGQRLRVRGLERQDLSFQFAVPSDAFSDDLKILFGDARRSMEDMSTRTHTSVFRERLEETLDRHREDIGGVVLGVEVGLGASSLVMGLPSAVTSAQCEDVRRVVVLSERSSESQTAAEDTGSVHVINCTEQSVAFINGIVAAVERGAVTSRPVLLHCDDTARVPTRIENHPGISVVRSRDVDEMLVQITDWDDGSGAAVGLGDKVYVFAPVADERVSDIQALRFIQGLDVELGKRTGSGDGHGPGHDGVYVAVESRSKGSRFLFEQMFVDKIFDTDLPRRNFFAHFVDRFYGGGRVDRSRNVLTGHVAEFRAAVEYAEYFRPLVIRSGDDSLKLGGLSATSSLAGRSFREARRLVRQFSEPSIQVLAVASVNEVVGADAAVEVEVRLPHDDELLTERDRVLMVAII